MRLAETDAPVQEKRVVGAGRGDENVEWDGPARAKWLFGIFLVLFIAALAIGLTIGAKLFS